MRRVVRAGRLVRFRIGGSIAVQNGPADGAYLLLSGQARVSRHGVEVGVLQAGDVIGEIALLEGSLRTASVVAESEIEAVHLEPRVAAGLYDDVPEFRRALEETARERLAADRGRGQA